MVAPHPADTSSRFRVNRLTPCACGMCVRLRAPNVRKHRKNATTTTTTRTHLKCVRKDDLEKHLSRRLLTQCHPRSARLSDVYPSTTTPLPHTFVLLAQILTPANQHNNTPTRPERTGALHPPHPPATAITAAFNIRAYRTRISAKRFGGHVPNTVAGWRSGVRYWLNWFIVVRAGTMASFMCP